MPALLYGPPSLPHPSPAVFSPLQFQIQTRRNKDRTLSTATDGNCAPADVCVWKQGDFLLQKRRRDEQVVSVEKVLSLFLSVGFEIIVDSADWMKAENGGIQTTGCAFRGAAAGNFSDLERNLVKLKTLGAGVGVFNGTVRTEREFPLKILFLACAQGFVVLFITRNGAEISRSRSPNTIYSRFVF